MKASELRIGNYVKLMLNDEDFTIIRIMLTDLEYIEQKQGVYKPIPLTEEWLLKFGMTKFEDSTPFNYRWNKKTKYFEIRYASFGDGSKGWQALYLHGKYWTRIKYVHSFQNLYFALTGEEITFKSE